MTPQPDDSASPDFLATLLRINLCHIGYLVSRPIEGDKDMNRQMLIKFLTISMKSTEETNFDILFS